MQKVNYIEGLDFIDKKKKKVKNKSNLKSCQILILFI